MAAGVSEQRIQREEDTGRVATSRAQETAAKLEAAVDIAKETRTLIFAALGAVAFVAISIFSIRDCDLISGTGMVTLPLLDADVPLPVFFFATPLFLVLLFAYVHVDMRRSVEGLPRSATIPVWPLSEIPVRPLGKGLALSLITNIIVWGAWPAVTVMLAWRVMPLGDPWLGPLNVMSVAVAFAVTVWNLSKVRTRRVDKTPWPIGLSTCVLLGGGLVVTALVCTKVLRPRDLPARYTDFRGADIVGLDLSGRDLRQANFARATLPQAILRGADLRRAAFTLAELEYALFCDAALEFASFRGAKARNANFRCGKSRFRAQFIDFTDADLRGVDFATSIFRTAPRADLTNASFWKADLNGADLSASDVTRANFSEARAHAASFDGARGDQAVFYRAKLNGARFGRAQLDRPNFTAADLQGADFSEAVLTGARLAGADLRKARLGGCRLTDADVTADTNFAGASYDKFTVFSESFVPSDRGMVCVSTPEDCRRLQSR